MYNKVFLIGNLARDPEVRFTPNGLPVARLVVAVNRFSHKGSENEADFINVAAWRRLAEICGEFLKKGRPVAIEGRLEVRPYEKNGVKKVFAEVVADNIQMLGKKEESLPAGRQAAGSSHPVKEPLKEATANEDEIPF